MSKYIRATKEEKEIEMELVLKAIKQGQSYKKIANDLGKSIQYVANIKKVLIERHLITQEEIDFLTKANSKVSTLKKTVLQQFEAGKDMEEIAREQKVSPATIARIRDILIQEGLITLDKIHKSKKKIAERELIKSKIFKGLQSGKFDSEISSELRVSLTTIKRIKRELISEGKISEEQILNLQNKLLEERNYRRSNSVKSKSLKGLNLGEKVDDSKLGEQEKQIVELLLGGYPLRYISKELNIDPFDLTNSIRILKKGKYITSAQINEARNKLKQEEESVILMCLKRGYTHAEIAEKLQHWSRSNITLRIDALVASGKITKKEIEQYKYEAVQGEKEVKEFVLAKLQLGFTVKEIIDADENGFLTERRVRDAIAKLIQDGSITESEMEKAKSKRVVKKKKDNLKRILRLLKKGKTYQEIADELDVSYNLVLIKVSQLKKSGKISNKDQEKLKNQKKNNRYSDVYKKILLMLRSGYTQQEIAQELGKSNHFVFDRIKELKERGKITDEDIDNGKSDRLQREEREEKELIKKHEEIKLVLLKERKLDSFYCEKFILSCWEMYQANLLQLDDITLLRTAIEYIHITEHSIRIMLKFYISFKQYKEAIKFLNSCIGYLTEDPKLIELATKGKLVITHYLKQLQAVDMLKNGMSLDYVFRRVGLTETEVIELNKKYVMKNLETTSISFEGFDI